MIVKNGKVIAIDSVSASMPLSGNGQPWSPLGISGVKSISAIEPIFFKETENNLVFGITESIKTVYFSGKLGKAVNSRYFSLDGNILTVSPEIEHFNLTLNYKVTLGTDRAVDSIYGTTLKVESENDIVHTETHYIEGIKPSECYSTALNLANSSSFTFSFVQVPEILATDAELTCIGFIMHRYGQDIVPFVDTEVSGYRLVGWDPVYNVLGGNEPDEYIDFGDNKALEV